MFHLGNVVTRMEQQQQHISRSQDSYTHFSLFNLQNWAQQEREREREIERERWTDRPKEKWEDNIQEWTGMGFAITTQAAENRTMWKRIVTKSFGVPQPDRTEWKNSKGVTAYTQIRKCVMKFCQFDKI